MIITNKHNISREIYDAVVARQGEYDPGGPDVWSVTSLIQPPRIAILEKRYYNEMETDVTDCLESWYGHMMHDVLETDETSKRLFARYTTTYGTATVSGAYDYYKDGVLKDYKRTNVSSMVYGSRGKKWEEQVNCYAHLIRSEGAVVQEIHIEVFLRDWVKAEAQRRSTYFQTPQWSYPVQPWDSKVANNFMRSRLSAMQRNMLENDDDLDPCSPEDMWESDTTWAVKKKGNKRASKVCSSEVSAEKYISKQKTPTQFTIEKRPGKRTRCEDWCSVNKWCNQYKEYCDAQS